MLDRQYQKTQQPQRRPCQPSPAAPATSQWQQQYGAPAEEEDEEENDDAINLATLLNILDGECSKDYTYFQQYPYAVLSLLLQALTTLAACPETASAAMRTDVCLLTGCPSSVTIATHFVLDT